MSPNNGYKTTCNTLYHKVIEISSVLSCLWLLFYLPSTCFSCFWIKLIKDEEDEVKIPGKSNCASNCASSVCVQTNASACSLGKRPNPFWHHRLHRWWAERTETLKTRRRSMIPHLLFRTHLIVCKVLWCCFFGFCSRILTHQFLPLFIPAHIGIRLASPT